LALLSRIKRDFSTGINAIVEDDVSTIAIANPKIAPYGYAAVEAMQKDDLYAKVVKKFIYAESVSQVITYTLSAADVGFVAKSSLFSPHMVSYTKGAHWIDVNPTYYQAINQGVVILKQGEDKEEVEQFYTFLFSPKGQKILRDFG
jgi:molybdate transport system substrate-binding protein